MKMRNDVTTPARLDSGGNGISSAPLWCRKFSVTADRSLASSRSTRDRITTSYGWIARWDTHNGGRDPVCEHLVEIEDAIVSQFGRGRDEYEHNGRTYVKQWPFPAYHDGTGCSHWWQITSLLDLAGYVHGE